MAKAALLIGSNLGDRYNNLKKASLLLRLEGDVLSQSSVYETAPWGKPDQPAFLNQALLLDTQLSPEKLMFRLLHIEKSMGRERSEKWGERLIDIDILYYDSFVRDTDHVKIPHPHLPERRFSLIPLAEISEDWVHPILGKSVEQMLNECQDKGEVSVFQEIYNE